jgi:hypothetical protein
MGYFLLDTELTGFGFLRDLEQIAGDTAVHTEQGQRDNFLVGLAQATDQLLKPSRLRERTSTVVLATTLAECGRLSSRLISPIQSPASRVANTSSFPLELETTTLTLPDRMTWRELDFFPATTINSERLKRFFSKAPRSDIAWVSDRCSKRGTRRNSSSVESVATSTIPRELIFLKPIRPTRFFNRFGR